MSLLLHCFPSTPLPQATTTANPSPVQLTSGYPSWRLRMACSRRHCMRYSDLLHIGTTAAQDFIHASRSFPPPPDTPPPVHLPRGSTKPRRPSIVSDACYVYDCRYVYLGIDDQQRHLPRDYSLPLSMFERKVTSRVHGARRAHSKVFHTSALDHHDSVCCLRGIIFMHHAYQHMI